MTRDEFEEIMKREGQNLYAASRRINSSNFSFSLRTWTEGARWAFEVAKLEASDAEGLEAASQAKVRHRKKPARL